MQVSLSRRYLTRERSVEKGYISAPMNVRAEAGDRECTLTWDSPAEVPDGDEILGFVLLRYRWDGSYTEGQWNAKAPVEIGNVNRFRVKELENGRRYRFTVMAKGGLGVGQESEPCEEFRPHQPLPDGWEEEFDDELNKHYYHNKRLDLLSLVYPEKDPHFADSRLLEDLSQLERDSLMKSYDLIMEAHTELAISDLVFLARDMGEAWRFSDMANLVRDQSQNYEATGISTYRDFIKVAHAVKQRSIQNGLKWNKWWRRTKFPDFIARITGLEEYMEDTYPHGCHCICGCRRIIEETAEDSKQVGVAR